MIRTHLLPPPGEEVDIDLSHSDQDSPVMWMRVDSEMVWLRKMNLEMPDYMWQVPLYSVSTVLVTI